MTSVRYAVEGWTDEPVAEKLIRLVGRSPIKTFIARGSSNLDPRVSGFNRAAAHSAWLVLRDLDRDLCPSHLTSTLLSGASLAAGMCLRVPVRAVEAWLLADADAVAEHFRISPGRLPWAPDQEPNPKLSLVNACRRSRSRTIQRAMVPRQGSGAVVGPEYSARIRHFAQTLWDPERAMLRSPSLMRSVDRMRAHVGAGAW